MRRKVYITGLGPIGGLGIGIGATWENVLAGRSAIKPIAAFDASAFTCRVAAEAPAYKIGDYVPKSYRKATKVMARDIELAVIAADAAAKDAALATKGTVGEAGPFSYEPSRVACHIGSGLIAADIDELTSALVEARVAEGPGAGDFDIRKWGQRGMQQLTPLWLLKYLPNMLACHVTIIHDAHGPSNTITCGEASSGLSMGESLRTIQRGAADVGFCGGAESRLNPMAFLRQQLLGRLVGGEPTTLRVFDEASAGTVIGEGGGIVVLEAAETFEKRGGTKQAYAEVAGFAAAQTVHRPSRNMEPDPEGKGIAAAIRNALREAGVSPADVDLIVPFGSGVAKYDAAEVAALRGVFGEALREKHVVPLKPLGGNCGAGAGGLEVSIAAKALAEGIVPPVLGRDRPVDGVGRGHVQAQQARLRHVMVTSTAFSGQTNALVLRRVG